MNKFKIAPSMMCADFINLKHDLDICGMYGADYLHIDIMDGHYVPNFTLGIDYFRALQEYSSIPLDIHLMIENVDSYVQDFARIPNAVVSFHPEGCYHPLRTIDTIRKCGARPGIGLDPAMPIESVRHMLPDIDLICIMMVSPGYAGQKLIPHIMTKLHEVSEYIRTNNYKIEIEVDGNVSWENVSKMLDAGAEVFVAGSSSLFDKKIPLDKNIAKFRSILNEYEQRTRKIDVPDGVTV